MQVANFNFYVHQSKFYIKGETWAQLDASFTGRCLINKSAFSYHFRYAWAATPHLFPVSPALSPASVVLGVIWVSLLGCNQASHSQWSESHWTRQKCSAARCQYTPTPAICRRAFLSSSSIHPPPSPRNNPPRLTSPPTLQFFFRLSTTPLCRVCLFCRNMFCQRVRRQIGQGMLSGKHFKIPQC